MDKTILDGVFHAYDVRGIAHTQIGLDFFYKLGNAFASFLQAKKIAVGFDIRPDSPAFAEAFSKGANAMGCNVVNIGEIATEMVYFTVGEDKTFDGGVTITASHNPAGYTGCKMVAKGAKALSKNWGLEEIKSIVAKGHTIQSTQPGNITLQYIYPAFKQKIRSILTGITLPPLSLIVDAGNGVGGKVFDYVFGDLPLNVERMYFEPNGNFPNHVPDPIKEENISELKKQVLFKHADLGIAIDGDADRVFFVDKKGRNPSGIYTAVLFAKYFASLQPGAAIIHDPRVTRPLVREITPLNARPLQNKPGHSLFKDRMKEEDALFGAEMSAHYFYKDFYYCDSGMMTIAYLLKFIASGINYTEEMDFLYSKYNISGEVNYKLNNPSAKLLELKEIFNDGKQEEIDGVTVEYPSWRFNVRISNTEPLIRLNIEADTPEELEEKFIILEKLISGERQNRPAFLH